VFNVTNELKPRPQNQAMSGDTATCHKKIKLIINNKNQLL